MREGESPQQQKWLKFYSAEDKRGERHESEHQSYVDEEKYETNVGEQKLW